MQIVGDTLCRYCYEKYVNRSGKTMLLCKVKEDDKNCTSEMMQLCICQRFCSDKDKYIPYKQSEKCKLYE